jgi:hypothetical protein
MTNQHQITPPSELLEQWVNTAQKLEGPLAYTKSIALQAAQWGADQQLAEDAEWLDQHALDAPHLKITPVGESLKEAMRPKPPSLKELALEALREAESSGCLYVNGRSDIIRQGLEALPND